MKRKGKTILAGIGTVAAAVAAAAAATYGTTAAMVKLAMDRNPSAKSLAKNHNRIRGYGKTKEHPETEDLSKAAADRLEQMPHDRVTITGRDGLKLVGHWFPQQNAARVVLAMHGWRSSWTADFGAITPFFQQSGCSILFAEQRGHGESEGKHIGFGMLERHDVLEWIRWIRETCGEAQPVYLAGVSMGAATVLMAAGLELPENVHGILADCGFLSAQEVWKHVSEHNLHVRYGGIRRALASRQCRKRIGMAADDYTTLDAMAQCRVPVLFIHGTEDRFVPVQATLENYRACAAPKRLLLVPGAGHAVSYHKDQKRYEDAVLDFWRTFDQG